MVPASSRLTPFQLTDFPMYRLAEVEVAALYPRIREVALDHGYQGRFKITNYSKTLKVPSNAQVRMAASSLML
ncbi:hypothetical protein T07_7207 [Trichinella nelsoni]|uniref:Uncharacterized protein n=1 Tax=Trichinella nelsoni TaxID=6336 RepID=A0A0V0SAT8_9BILA|nr:hypothetical protein T07_7207 [Trichinella nelsoni]